MTILTEVLQTVVENGRVDGNADGTFNAESMEAEIEFECAMRELDDATTAECVAFALSGKNVKAPRKNNQEITDQNPRAAGAPKLHEQPLQRLHTYAWPAEVARVRAMLKPRQVIEVCLAECNRLADEQADTDEGARG